MCVFLSYFLDKIVRADVLVLGPYIHFTYLFVVTIEYKTGKKVNYCSPTLYKWIFERPYIIGSKAIIINTTFPLLNHTFEFAGEYQYYLMVSNTLSRGFVKENFQGYCVITT